MDNEEPKIKRIKYGLIPDNTEGGNSTITEQALLMRKSEREGGIIKGTLNLNDLIDEPQAEKEIPTLEQFYLDRELKQEQAIAQERLRREAERRIEEPVGSSYTESEYYFREKERRVSYLRTFGRTASRRKDLDRIVSIGLLALCGILGVISFILSH